MARITVEDSLRNAGNRFALVLLTAKRARQLLKGSQPLAYIRHNREVVAALREIAEGKVFYAYPEYLRDAKVDYRAIADDMEFIGDEEYAD